MSDQKSEVIFNTISREEAEKYKKSSKILILTATKVETQALHRQLDTINGTLYKVGVDNYTYYIGKFGGHSIFHIQCMAGSVSSNGSAVVTNHGIGYCSPTMILMVGIAFGMDNKKQKIGDILVSETIAPYEIQRLGVGRNIQRGGFPKASNYLSNRFRNHNWTNSYQLTLKGKRLNSQVIQGLLLSGEKLVDDPEVKKKLLIDFPESIGGEMEGIGIASCCEPRKIDWIIVKGICDFADGNKNRNKKKFQNIASNEAVNYCKSVLSEPHILAELGIKPDETIDNHPANISKVLFKNYQSDVEPFYVQREVDNQFNGFLSNYSIWLYGLSGSGKSTLIVRNLNRSGYDLIQIYLASASDYNIVSILKDIHYNLLMYFNLEKNITCNGDTDELVNVISNLIIEKFNFKKHIIYLDEIPEYRNDGVFNSFVQALYAINVNVQRKISNVESVFVLSSISSPKLHLHDSQNKMFESFKVIELTRWRNEDILILTNMINDSLKLNLTDDEIANIVRVSFGLPRYVKRIIRDFISTKNSPDYSLSRILSEIEEETK